MSEQQSVKRVDGDKGTDRYAQRRQRRRERRADRRAGGGWIGGILLIVLGGLFLLQNTGFLPQFDNWWALFLLLPAAGMLAAALGAYRRNGNRWSAESTGPFVGSILLVGLTAVFLLEINYAWLWPLLLIAAGLLLLGGTFFGGMRSKA